MRMSRLIAAVLLAGSVALPGVPAMAQTIGQIGGPAEQPPPGFTGRQYVDSRGCLFLRAGIGDRTAWVPRIGNDRRVICNQAPSGRVAAAPRAPVAAPAPVPAAAPAPAPSPVPAPRAPRTAATPLSNPAPAATDLQTALQGFCAVRSPGLYTVSYDSRRLRVDCRAPAVAAPAAAPRAPVAATAPVAVPARPVAPVAAPGVSPDLLRRYCLGLTTGEFFVNVGGDMVRVQCNAALATGTERRVADLSPPRGYRPVWDDGRLNPRRGLPNTPPDPAAVLPVQVATGPAPSSATLSTRSPAPTAPAPTAVVGQFVQVGAFGVPENARNVAARLTAAGLPVHTRAVTRNGRTLQMVMAGPLPAGTAASALGTVRGLGFSDAYLR